MVGMLGLVSCLELVALFVALEIMSVAIYAMAGLHRDRAESQEAAVKYFITGAFSSAFFLYGVALLYGVSGSTSLDRIAVGRGRAPPDGPGHPGPARRRLPARGLRVQGGERAVPHVGARRLRGRAHHRHRAHVRGGEGGRLRRRSCACSCRRCPRLAGEWQPAVAVLAIVTMVMGNLGALAQTNLKRMLAYSSVAHAGYLLTALVAGAGSGDGGHPLLPGRLRGGEPGRLRRPGRAGPRRPRAAVARRRGRAGRAAPAAGRGPGRVPGLPHRRARSRPGFVGKFYLFSAAVGAGYVEPGHRRHADERGLRLLLPAGGGGDVHARAGRGGRAGRPSARPPPPPWPSRPWSCSAWASFPAPCWAGPARPRSPCCRRRGPPRRPMEPVPRGRRRRVRRTAREEP